jgi:hypothetical protein
MHRPALARAQRRPVRGRTGSRTLENRLSWHGASRSWTHSGSCGRSSCTYRRGWSEGRLVHRTRPRLRNDHSWRRRGWRHGCARGNRLCSHGGRLRRRRHGPWRHRRWRAGARRSRRCCNGRPRGNRSRRSHGSRRLRRNWRRGGGKRRPRGRSRDYKFRRSGRRRSWHLGNWRGCRWRGGRGYRLDRWRCNRRRSVRGRWPLLLADDGP